MSVTYRRWGPLLTVGRAWDLESRGPRFESRPGRRQVVTLGKTIYPHCSKAEVRDALPL